MNHLKKDTFFEWAQELLRRPGHTVEFNILGRRIVMTDDQANLKTIFATNVDLLTNIISVKMLIIRIVLNVGKGPPYAGYLENHSWRQYFYNRCTCMDGKQSTTSWPCMYILGWSLIIQTNSSLARKNETR